MGGHVGVQRGRICPGCGEENSVPLGYGLPGFEDVEQAERGGFALGGCCMPEEPADFACRSCGLEWGSDSDPTADEAAFAELLGVGFDAVVRALGTGWRRETAATGDDGVAWFVSGEPAQVSVGVQGPWFVVARPLTSDGEHRPGPLMGDGPRYSRDDVLHLPDVVADAVEAIAARRRRSFRWCRSCRRVHPPESFAGSAGTCRRCADVVAGAWR